MEKNKKAKGKSGTESGFSVSPLEIIISPPLIPEG